MAALAEAGRSYALLADGTTMTIRAPGLGDYEPVRHLHEAMSPDNLYFRFFSASRVSAEREAQRVCLEARPGLVALLGLLGEGWSRRGSPAISSPPMRAPRKPRWRLPTACTGAVSPRCCWSTWSRWPRQAA